MFETIIRVLGGYESAYELSGDVRFIHLAKDIGERMLLAFDTPTGIPFAKVNLQT